MTAIARFEVIPVREGSMSDDIARAVAALEEFDVAYETTATDTVVEADSLDELFDAVRAAHEAIGGNRVISSLEIDDQRGRDQRARDRVDAVERSLGHPPRREHADRGDREERRGRPQQGSRRAGYRDTEREEREESEGSEQPERYVSRYGGSGRDPRRRDEAVERYRAGYEAGRREPGDESREYRRFGGRAEPLPEEGTVRSRWERRAGMQQPPREADERREEQDVAERARDERRWSRRRSW